jgi:hypothetical protein
MRMVGSKRLNGVGQGCPRPERSVRDRERPPTWPSGRTCDIPFGVMRQWALLLGLLAGCTPPWTPASVVDSLRVIGVRAEPPEIRPGQAAVLQELIINPLPPGGTTTLWLGCDPDPFGEGRGACTDVGALSDASSLVNTTSLPPGVKLIGFNQAAAYAAAPTLFDVLPPDDPRRASGTVGLVISIAVGEVVSPTATQAELAAVGERVRNGTTPSQLTLFRVAVSESTNPNHNPVADRLTVNLPVRVGATVELQIGDNLMDLTAHDYEEYDETTPSGIEHKTEQISVAWYTTAGRFTEDRVTLGSDVKSKLTISQTDPDNPFPDDRHGTLWAVLRDSRGGQSWSSWPTFICDASAPAAVLDTVDPSPFVIHGENLDQILDVFVDDGPVDGAFDPATGTWKGTTPLKGGGVRLVEADTTACISTRTVVTVP